MLGTVPSFYPPATAASLNFARAPPAVVSVTPVLEVLQAKAVPKPAGGERAGAAGLSL
mgnify:CR=1 FL=1